MDNYNPEEGDDEQIYNIKPNSERFILNKWRDYSYNSWKRDQNMVAQFHKDDSNWRNESDLSWKMYKDKNWRKDKLTTFLVYKGTNRYDFAGIVKEINFIDATINVFINVERKEYNEQFECSKNFVEYLCYTYFYDIIYGKHRSILDILHWIDMHYRGEGDAYYDNDIAITRLPDQVIA